MRRNNLEEIAGDYEIVWSNLLEAGLDPASEFAFDFRFYSSSESGIQGLENFLKELQFVTKMKVVRTALIFKGYELKGTLDGLWTKETLYQCLSILTDVAEKYGVVFEGYGALIRSSK